MSRSGYHSDGDSWDLIRWRGAVASAIRGKRGQSLLLALRDALDSMPEKRLIANELIEANGEVCALGCLARARDLDVSQVDPDDRDTVAGIFNIAPAMAAEIVYVNDEYNYRCSPEERWKCVREWVEEQIVKSEPKE